MLDRDNIKSASVSEEVEKVPRDEKKDYHKAPLCVLHSCSIQRVDQHIANSINSLLPTRIHSVYLKKLLMTSYIKCTQKKVQ